MHASSWSGCLPAELVDGTTALRFGEAFERGDVELALDLIGETPYYFARSRRYLICFGLAGASEVVPFFFGYVGFEVF